MSKKTIKYEDNAVYLKNIEGWVCKNCKLFYGKTDGGKHRASLCCATDIPCDCGERNFDRGYTTCSLCRLENTIERFQKDIATWKKWPKQVWPDHDMVYSIDSSNWFYDPDEVYYR